MSNTQVMQTAMTSTVKLIVIMLCIILSGIAVPFIISVIISGLSSSITLEDCTVSVPFWLFSVIGMICSMIYISEEIKDISDAQYSHR